MAHSTLVLEEVLSSSIDGRRVQDRGRTVTTQFNEYDVVRISRLCVEAREFQGTEGVMRSPAVGDVATVVWAAPDGSSLSLEMVDDEGYTVWLADFTPDELTLVCKWSA